MKKLVGIVGRITLLTTIFLVVAIVYSTAKGYMVWYFRVSGSVTVDGHKTGGYVHANTQRNMLLVTRTDGSKLETYLVPVESGKLISGCGDWHPIRYLPIPTGDLNPPCSRLNEKPGSVADPPLVSTVVRARRSVEFSTASGKRVKAEWYSIYPFVPRSMKPD